MRESDKQALAGLIASMQRNLQILEILLNNQKIAVNQIDAGVLTPEYPGQARMTVDELTKAERRLRNGLTCLRCLLQSLF